MTPHAPRQPLSRRTVLKSAALGSLAVALQGCGGGVSGGKVVKVYSPHGEHLEGDIKKRFEAAHPGTTVEFQDMGGATIFAKVAAEKALPRADVWWGGAPSDFARAEKQGLLEPYTPEWVQKLPADARSASGCWAATFRSPLLILYNAKKISATEAPKDWDELLDSKWRGRIAIRDIKPSTTMKTAWGALILRANKRAGNDEAGFEFLKKLDANTGAYAANPQILNELLAGDTEYALTIWTLADAPLLKDRGYPFEFTFPPEVPIVLDSIALLKGGPNPSGAKLFYDFVNSPEQLLLMAKERHRIPVREDLPKEQLPEWMQNLTLKPMAVDWQAFAQNIDAWIARWDTEIKGRFFKKA
jgi:iron(III) transport system substrate-binding protein